MSIIAARLAHSVCHTAAVVDHQFADPELAAWYDRAHGWGSRRDFDFYLPIAMTAGSVLDVGCGTGAFLHGVRDAGHTGRLCGLDPALGMLAQARRRSDVEWVHGDLASVEFDREFDLVVMTGHAFQVFVTDAQVRHALAAIHGALVDNGRFVFETRNPLARAWEGWTPEHARDVTDSAGVPVRIVDQLDAPFDGRVVAFTTTFTSPAWQRPAVSRSTLRFLDVARLGGFLADAGFVVERQCGDWDGGPLRDDSPEIITVAVKPRAASRGA
jgi:ubiquinone/menaquinone biosynthesis C-methylase UbiE